MAFNNRPNLRGNQNPGGFGIGAYDYVSHTYDSQGDLTDSRYYRGGSQDSGTLVGHIEFTYDSEGNLETAERIS